MFCVVSTSSLKFDVELESNKKNYLKEVYDKQNSPNECQTKNLIS